MYYLFKNRFVIFLVLSYFDYDKCISAKTRLEAIKTIYICLHMFFNRTVSINYVITNNGNDFKPSATTYLHF